jgi:hypothetical protein
MINRLAAHLAFISETTRASKTPIESALDLLHN